MLTRTVCFSKQKIWWN